MKKSKKDNNGNVNAELKYRVTNDKFQKFEFGGGSLPDTPADEATIDRESNQLTFHNVNGHGVAGFYWSAILEKNGNDTKKMQAWSCKNQR